MQMAENIAALGVYLKDRRARLDPAALGFSLARRRTPGLRREEVAQRANVSATWYTWLEQGRGGAPSAEALDRIARALMLTEAEREHLFLLALGRAPDVRYRQDTDVSPRMRRVLDALPHSPAYIKTAIWDLVAWNRAAAAVFGYDALAPDQRNILRRIFLDPGSRAMNADWEGVARFVVAAFRAEAVRTGVCTTEQGKALVRELCGASPDFDRMWREHDVGAFGEGVKALRHPAAGLIALEYSAFAVEGRPGLGLVIYNPATPADVERVRALMDEMQEGVMA
jgi:transcriptional regulator with XRE-family HTH domain